MYLNIVFLPFLGSLVAGFFGRFLGGRGSGLITISCVGLSFFLSGLAFYEVGLGGSSTYLYLMPWLESDSFHVDWAFCFDSLTGSSSSTFHELFIFIYIFYVNLSNCG